MPTDLIDSVRAQLHARLLVLRTEMTQIEGALASLAGKPPAHRTPAAPTATRTATRRTTARRRTGRVMPVNTQPLRAYIRDVLQKEPEGLTLDALTERVLAAGYQTTSGNPRSVVGQEVSGKAKHLYRRDDLKRWHLREPPPIAAHEPAPAKRRKTA